MDVALHVEIAVVERAGVLGHGGKSREEDEVDAEILRKAEGGSAFAQELVQVRALAFLCDGVGQDLAAQKGQSLACGAAEQEILKEHCLLLVLFARAVFDEQGRLAAGRGSVRSVDMRWDGNQCCGDRSEERDAGNEFGLICHGFMTGNASDTPCAVFSRSVME